MQKLKSTKKPNPYTRKTTITLKVNAEEMHELLKRATMYADRNLSEWLRFSGLNFKPTKEDFKK